MFVFPWYRVFDLATAVVAAGLAVAVLRAAPRKPANQVFALFMACIAGNFAAGFIGFGIGLGVPPDGAGVRLWDRIAYQFAILDPAALLFFALLFPRRAPRLDKPWMLALIAIPPLVLTITHLVWPWVFTPVRPWAGEPAALLAGNPAPRTPYELYLVAFYVTSLVLLVRNFLREESPLFRDRLRLVVLGVGVAVVPRTGIVGWLTGFSSLVTENPLTGSKALLFLERLGPPLLLLAAVALYALRTSPPRLRPEAARLVRALAALVGVVLSIIAIHAASSAVGGPPWVPIGEGLSSVLTGLIITFRWLVFGCVVGYALLKYQVFDVELRTQRWMRTAATAASLVALAAVAGLAADAWAPGNLGALAVAEGLVLAGAAAPVLWGSRKLVARAFPQAQKGDEDYLYRRKVEVYRANLEEALARGDPDASESHFLEDLRRSLGITEREHRLIVHMAELQTGKRPSRPLEQGQAVLGKYEVIRPLQEGAFGRAVLARDRTLDRVVVLKEVLPIWRGEPRMHEALVAEARLAARLNHPNVVTVHEVATQGDDVYLVMEYCEGGSLEERLAPTGTLPFLEVVSLGAEALAGLGAAHAAGIVHRDLKPSNLLLTKDQHLKVADFGIARSLDDRDRATVMRLSATGSQPGTVAYMSPEQVEGKDVDARSDLYGMAAVLHRMATGRHYLDLTGAGDFEARRRVLEAYPLLPARDLPAWFNEFLARGLAKRPEDRFPDAGAMRRALLDGAQGSEAAMVTTEVYGRTPKSAAGS